MFILKPDLCREVKQQIQKSMDLDSSDYPLLPRLVSGFEPRSLHIRELFFYLDLP